MEQQNHQRNYILCAISKHFFLFPGSVSQLLYNLQGKSKCLIFHLIQLHSVVKNNRSTLTSTSQPPKLGQKNQRKSCGMLWIFHDYHCLAGLKPHILQVTRNTYTVVLQLRQTTGSCSTTTFSSPHLFPTFCSSSPREGFTKGTQHKLIF